jgi:hypothetical protein
VFVTNHVLAGALIGRRFASRPATAFLVGFGSHLVMDSIPHWGCDMAQPGASDRFLRVAQRDGLLGLAAVAGCVWAADRKQLPATLAAIAGAVILDIDKPSQHFFDRNPVPGWLQQLHGRIQRESSDLMVVEVVSGLTLAIAEFGAPWPSWIRRPGLNDHAPS